MLQRCAMLSSQVTNVADSRQLVTRGFLITKALGRGGRFFCHGTRFQDATRNLEQQGPKSRRVRQWQQVKERADASLFFRLNAEFELTTGLCSSVASRQRCKFALPAAFALINPRPWPLVVLFREKSFGLLITIAAGLTLASENREFQVPRLVSNNTGQPSPDTFTNQILLATGAVGPSGR